MVDNAKPQAGAWDNMTTEEYAEGIKFDINIPVKFTFAANFTKPDERPNKDGDGVFYVFNGKVNGEDKAIMTSAWSLMRCLKEHEPLAGKTLLITKKLLGNKQQFFIDVPSDSLPREVASIQA